jgi:hypothetical protein
VAQLVEQRRLVEHLGRDTVGGVGGAPVPAAHAARTSVCRVCRACLQGLSTGVFDAELRGEVNHHVCLVHAGFGAGSEALGEPDARPGTA